jgi:hypothetical protein
MKDNHDVNVKSPYGLNSAFLISRIKSCLQANDEFQTTRAHSMTDLTITYTNAHMYACECGKYQLSFLFPILFITLDVHRQETVNNRILQAKTKSIQLQSVDGKPGCTKAIKHIIVAAEAQSFRQRQTTTVGAGITAAETHH